MTPLSAAAGGSERAWIRTTQIAGVCALVFYFAEPVFHVVPRGVGRWMFFLIGPAIALAAFAMLRALAARREDVARTIGLSAAVVAGLVMHLMAVIQTGNFTAMQARIAAAETAEARTIDTAVMQGVNNVQLSLDIGFDLWIAAAGLFLAVSALRTPGRRILGAIGLAAAAFALGMNVAFYPDPPAENGGIDGGPYLAGWFGVWLWLETRRRGAAPSTAAEG